MIKVLLLLLCLVPVVVRYFFRPNYKVHKTGAILITGSSSGIGRHAALEIAKMGYIVLAGVRKVADGEALQKDCESGCTLIPVIVDVADEQSVRKSVVAVQAILQEHNTKLIGLVNNAGLMKGAHMEICPMPWIRQMFDVNVFGLICMCQHYIPLVREAEGRIVNISSLAGLVSAGGMGPYNGSKHCVETITRSYRYELKAAKISVSAIEPGMVRTSMFEKDKATDELSKSLSPEMLKIYGPELLKRARGKDETFTHAPGPEVTTAAIKHALFDSAPQTQYPVSNFKGNPAWLVAGIFQWVPIIFGDRVMDFLVTEVFQKQ